MEDLASNLLITVSVPFRTPIAIVRQIAVEKHGGAIEVDSQVGPDTIFTILLPIEAL